MRIVYLNSIEASLQCSFHGSCPCGFEVFDILKCHRFRLGVIFVEGNLRRSIYLIRPSIELFSSYSAGAEPRRSVAKV